MKKLSLVLFFLLSSISVICQTDKNIITDIFIVKYSEKLEQPKYIFYKIDCPNGKVSRSGLSFKLYDGVHTSDDEDYVNNIWDKGHLAPAATFNCDREMVKKTFTYINCVLQHQSLNRGVWKELEEFERNLAKIYDDVTVSVECHFSSQSQILPTGATVPDGFTKIISYDDMQLCFYFPNEDTKGTDWIDYRLYD